MNIGVGVIGWGAIAEQCRRYVAVGEAIIKSSEEGVMVVVEA